MEKYTAQKKSCPNRETKFYPIQDLSMEKSKEEEDPAIYAEIKDEEVIYSRLYRLNISLAKNNLKKRNLTEKEKEEAEIWAGRKSSYNAGFNKRM